MKSCINPSPEHRTEGHNGPF